MAGEAMAVKSGTQQTGASAYKRGMRLPLAWTGGGRAVPDVNFNVDMTYLVPRLWRFKDTSHYGFVTYA